MINIVITDDNCQINCDKNIFFKFVTEKKEVLERAALISTITINESTVLGPGVLHLAADYGVVIRALGDDEIIVGHWRGHLPDAQIQLKYRQMQFIQDGEGKEVFASWLIEKLENQVSYLDNLIKEEPELIKGLQELKTFYLEKKFDSIIDREAILMKTYYQMMNKALPQAFQFQKRSRQPAEDGFNAMLNYSFSFLYGLVEDAIVDCGLDPYLGFYHSNERGGKALVYDMIEPFRPWVDEMLLKMTNTEGVLDPFGFEKNESGVFISQGNRKTIASQYYEEFETVIRYKNKQISKKSHVYLEAKRLKAKILKMKIDD